MASLDPRVSAEGQENGPRKKRKNREPFNAASTFDWFDQSAQPVGEGNAYRPSTNYTGLLGGIPNTFQNVARGFTNWWDTEILGNRRPKGGAAGDAVWGRDPGIPDAQAGTFYEGLPPTKSFSRTRARATQPLDEAQLPQGRSYTEILNELFDTLGGIGSEVPRVSYDPQRQTTRENADFARRSIGSVYDQLGEEIGLSNKRVGGAYDESRENLTQSGNEAVNATRSAFDAAQADQSRMLQELGIQDVIAQTIEEGRDLGGQGAQAVSDISQNVAADQAYNTQQQASAGEYGERLGVAGETARSTNLAGLERLLAQRLGEIDAAEAEANANAGWQSAFAPTDLADIAMQLFESEQGQAQSALDRLYEQYQMEQEAQTGGDDPLEYLRRAQAVNDALVQSGTDIPDWMKEQFARALFG